MRFFCRIGLHRWSFSTQLLDEPAHRTHTEVIRARCTREECARYGTWSLVHRETYPKAALVAFEAARIDVPAPG